MKIHIRADNVECVGNGVYAVEIETCEAPQSFYDAIYDAFPLQRGAAIDTAFLLLEPLFQQEALLSAIVAPSEMDRLLGTGPAPRKPARKIAVPHPVEAIPRPTES